MAPQDDSAAVSRHDGALSRRVARSLRDVPDFPSPGILFKDITPLLADTALLRETVYAMAEDARALSVHRVVGIESRGFLFGVPVALTLGVPFAPARKAGKLPWDTVREAYALEYRSDVLELHRDAVQRGERVLIVDDVLATGGTAAAAASLVHQLGGEAVALSVVVELGFLGGAARLSPLAVQSVVRFA